jgi:hypothetical protein
MFAAVSDATPTGTSDTIVIDVDGDTPVDPLVGATDVICF